MKDGMIEYLRSHCGTPGLARLRGQLGMLCGNEERF
jgi:hypothetical protein